MRIKKTVEGFKSLNLEDANNRDKILEFYQKIMPVLMKEIERLITEIDRLQIKYELKPYMRQ
jgi:hypothetical protein